MNNGSNDSSKVVIRMFTRHVIVTGEKTHVIGGVFEPWKKSASKLT